MNHYFYWTAFFLSTVLTTIITPQNTLAEKTECSNFWINPTTGQKECLNHRIPSSEADNINPNNKNPKSAKEYFVQGKIHHQKGEIIKAIEDYTKAIEADSDFTEVYNQRGIARMKQGQFRDCS